MSDEIMMAKKEVFGGCCFIMIVALCSAMIGAGFGYFQGRSDGRMEAVKMFSQNPTGMIEAARIFQEEKEGRD